MACKFGQFTTLVYINDAAYSDSVTHKWRDTEIYGKIGSCKAIHIREEVTLVFTF